MKIKLFKLFLTVFIFSYIVTEGIFTFTLKEYTYLNAAKTNLREFVSGHAGFEKDEHQWIKENLLSPEDIKPNNLAKHRIEKERHNKYNQNSDWAVSIFSVNDADTLLPSAVDNSELKSFPPIGDQGSIGSCSAFNTTYYQLTHMIGMEKGWDVKNDVDNVKKFSPKWTFNLTNGGQNYSMSVFDSYRLFLKSGAATWNEFPYDNNGDIKENYLEWPVERSIWRNALDYRIDNYGYVEIWDESNENTPVKNPQSKSLNKIKQLINNGHVLVLETNITGWRFTTVGDDPATEKDDMFENDYAAYASGKSVIDADGHVMTIVGYNDHIWVDINNNGIVDPGEKGAFKIANSWGTDDIIEFKNYDFTWYSNEGFIWLAYDALNRISAVSDSPEIPQRRNAFRYNNYAYWITPRINYTPKFLVEYTINTSNRYDIKTLFGFSNSSTYHPVSFWDPHSINIYPVVNIGHLSFDGTSTPCDATFVFDLTDFSEMYDNKDGNWYLNIIDEGSGNSGVLKNLKFIDLYNDKTYYHIDDMPIEFSNQSLIIGPVNVEKSLIKPKGNTLNNAMPIKRYNEASISLNDNLYIIGGVEPSKGYVNTVYEYDVQNDIWTEKSELEGDYWGVIHGTTLNDKIYITRKLLIEQQVEDSDDEGKVEYILRAVIEEYDPIKDIWTHKLDIDYNNCRGLIAIMGKILIIEYNEIKIEEDEENDTENDKEEETRKEIKIQQYDPYSNTIKTILEKELDWLNFSSVVINEKIYFIGGKRGADISSGIGGGLGGYYVDNVMMSYDIVKDVWEDKTGIPKGYGSMGVVSVNNKIYSVYRNQSTIGIMKYDPATNKWYKNHINLMARNGVKVSTSKNNIVIHGGSNYITSFILPHAFSDAVEIVDIDSIFKYGDVNGDGFINSIDYVLVKRYILGIIDKFPSKYGTLAADVDKNGSINSTDCVLIKRYILGIISEFEL
ncbi:UNVERIFIED_CONTAM: C1A family cysteine protease [Acetivibrio alkalicellulosi]